MTDEEIIKLAETAVSPMFYGTGEITNRDDGSFHVQFSTQTVIGTKSAFVTIKNGQIISAGAQG